MVALFFAITAFGGFGAVLGAMLDRIGFSANDDGDLALLGMLAGLFLGAGLAALAHLVRPSVALDPGSS